jgi:uncharacterized protein YkwD
VLRPLSRLLTARRVLPVLVGVLAVTGIVLVVPLMAAGRGGLSTAESGVTSTAGTSAPRSGVVTMGVDGEPEAPGTTAVPGAPGTTAGGPSTGAAPGTPDAPDAVHGTTTGAATAGGTSAGGTSEAPPAGSSTAGAPSATGAAPGPSSAGPSSAGPSSAGPSSAGPSSAGRSSSAAPAPAQTSTQEAPAPAQTSTPVAPAPAARTAAPAASGSEATVLALVNEARAAAGCGAVRADPALAAVARAHSADMRDRDYFSHDTPEGLSPFDRAEAAGITSARAENIAAGQRDAAAVMDAWMNSPGHRANILDCSLSTLGVGVAEGPGGPWWTQLFGA